MEGSDLERLKAAYQTWHDTKGEGENARNTWSELFADQIRIVSMGDTAPQIAFARPRHSRSEAVDYLLELVKDWKMVHWVPETFVSEGDRIAMFGRCAWTNRSTGKTTEVRIAHLWKFHEGRAIDLMEVFDSARAVAAGTA